MAIPLRIDFVSDVACPWCVIGLRSLMKALDELGDEVEAEIVFQPFELNPDMPPEGQNTFEHVQAKYGSTPEKSALSREALRESGEALGFAFGYGPDSRIWNTFDAHRLLHWAHGEGRQHALKEALFVANFTDGLSISDNEVLVRAAASAGLDARRARSVLVSGQFADEVRKDEATWRDRGIQAVPSIVFEERWMIQGGQPSEMFVQAIRQVIAQKAAAG
ncbi:MAG: DsbA family oxidoreductase [Alphaproteobacteria bacterium]|nr:DsbA family oxidoreductase [Alphaproteobacteria bacterium]